MKKHNPEHRKLKRVSPKSWFEFEKVGDVQIGLVPRPVPPSSTPAPNFGTIFQGHMHILFLLGNALAPEDVGTSLDLGGTCCLFLSTNGSTCYLAEPYQNNIPE